MREGVAQRDSRRGGFDLWVGPLEEMGTGEAMDVDILYRCCEQEQKEWRDAS